MTIVSLAQPPFICNTIIERDYISTNYPIPEMTACTVRLTPTTTEVYRWENVSGTFQWVRTYPDQATVDWLTQNSADISTLQTAMSSKADSSALTTLSSTVSSLSSAVAAKADTSTVTALAGTVSSLASSLKPVAYSGAYADLTGKPTIPAANVAWVPAAATRSLVTGTGATGFQPNASANTLAVYNVRTTSTASIAGNADGYIVLEVCPTNSATAGNWIEMARTSNSQVLTLAVTLNSVQGQGAALTGVIPAGWYAKLRQVTTTGTMAFAYVSGVETPMS